MLWAFGRRRGADLGQRRPGDRRGRCCTRSAPWAPSTAALCAAEPRATSSACAGRSAPRGRRARPRAATSSSSPAASGWRRCGPVVLSVLADRDAFGQVALLLGARSPADAALPRRGAGAGADQPGIEVLVTVDHAEPAWAGDVGVVTRLLDRLDARPARAPSAFVCGPEIMMRFAAAGLLDRGVPADRHRGVAGAQHGVRHRPLRALPARARCSCAATGPVYAYDVAAPLLAVRGRCDWPARRAPAPGGLEVRVVRRLPAHPARLRGRAAGRGRRRRDRLLPRGGSGRRSRALRPLARRGLGHDARRRRAHPCRSGRCPGTW